MSCESECHIRAGTNVSDCKAKVILNEYLPLRWRDERSRGIFVAVRGGVEQRSPEGISYAHLSLGGISLWHKLDQATYSPPTWQDLMRANVMEVLGQIYESVKQKSD